MSTVDHLESARELRSRVAARAAGDWDEGPVPENYRDLGDLGLAAATVPHAFGGPGIGITAASSIVTEVAKGDASTALVLAMHYIHTTRLFSAEHLSPRIERLAAEIVEASGLVGLAASEKLSGPPSRGGVIETTAELQRSGEWILNGHKRYATGSRAVSHMIIVARVVVPDSLTADDRPATGSLGHFLAPLPTAGLVVDDTWDTLGLRGTSSNDLVLTDVRLDSDALVGTQVPGEPSTDRIQPMWWPTMLASMHLGIAEAAKDEAVAFSRTPRNDGVDGVLADMPRIQDRAASIELELIPARAVLADALQRIESADPAFTPTQAAAVKFLVHRHSAAAVDHAGQLVGAASLWRTSPIQRHYRDIRAALHNPPTEDVVRAQLGAHVLTPNTSAKDR